MKPSIIIGNKFAKLTVAWLLSFFLIVNANAQNLRADGYKDIWFTWGNCQLVIHYNPKIGTAKDFVIKYNSSQMKAAVEKIPLTAMEDKGNLEKWGDTIYRINFLVTSPKVNDKINFVIAAK